MVLVELGIESQVSFTVFWPGTTAEAAKLTWLATKNLESNGLSNSPILTRAVPAAEVKLVALNMPMN